MVFATEEATSQQQQKGIRVMPCYDEIIAFLKDWFPHIAELKQKPILRIKRYSGNSASYQKVAEWVINPVAYGRLKEISIICDDYVNSVFWIKISGVDEKEFKLQSALTLPYSDLRLQAEQVVQVYAKSNGVAAIVADISIIGVEFY